jgi:protein-L-isoaspartate(D-aspartate) O-methyltransferase
MLAIAPTFDGRRTIPSPECRALIRQMLKLGPSDKVLEIGTGSGTMTSEFGATGAEVHSIELEPWVDTTQIIGDCVYLHTGDGADGLPRYAPFTAIVATCGVEQIPRAWVEQLASGGRLVVPIGDAASQRLTLFEKAGGELLPKRICAYTRFSMMKERPKPEAPKYQAHGAH